MSIIADGCGEVVVTQETLLLPISAPEIAV
jgi:hypothetical protein